MSANHNYFLVVAFALLLEGCGGGPSSGNGGLGAGVDDNADQLGTISVGITDAPAMEIRDLSLHLAKLEFGESAGGITSFSPSTGPVSIELTSLQNGRREYIVEDFELPAGRYEWLQLTIEMDLSHLELEDGRHHALQGVQGDSFRLEQQFTIEPGVHHDFVLDIDVRQSIHRHGSGGMMTDRYEFHPAMRFIRVDQSGSLVGTVDNSLIDLFHEDCNSSEGGNWAYLFPGHVSAPDDLHFEGSSREGGPMAMDRVEMDVTSGEYRYHFAYLPAGTYRIGFSCAGEWDDAEESDYPEDIDGRFDFQAFTEPLEVREGQVTSHAIMHQVTSEN